jgi:hypothetical protein
MAAVETETPMATEPPDAFATVIVHVPGPTGVTVYEATCEFAFVFTVAIVPDSGAHVSLSANTPA